MGFSAPTSGILLGYAAVIMFYKLLGLAEFAAVMTPSGSVTGECL